MSSNMEDISGTDASTEEGSAAPAVSSDYPKVQANAAPTQEGAPLGSRPLSVSESDLPHHHAADPKNIGESDSES